MQKTFTVEHANAHQPTDEQIRAALVAELRAEGYRAPAGDVRFRMVENVSGGPSKVVAEFDEPDKRAGADDKD